MSDSYPTLKTLFAEAKNSDHSVWDADVVNVSASGTTLYV